MEGEAKFKKGRNHRDALLSLLERQSLLLLFSRNNYSRCVEEFSGVLKKWRSASSGSSECRDIRLSSVPEADLNLSACEMFYWWNYYRLTRYCKAVERLGWMRDDLGSATRQMLLAFDPKRNGVRDLSNQPEKKRHVHAVARSVEELKKKLDAALESAMKKIVGEESDDDTLDWDVLEEDDDDDDEDVEDEKG